MESSVSPAPRADWVTFREGDPEIAGWVFLEKLGTDRPELGIAVADRHQNRGLGSAMIDHALLGARGLGLDAVYLIVVQDNERAITLYERHGFETCGEHFDAHDQLSYFQMVARP
jgi:ribosomal protein S18 acetylase RimI-like enzyme